jgi:hemerythrin
MQPFLLCIVYRIMSLLAWSAELALDHPQMDETHREFVVLLNTAGEALARSQAEGLQAWEALVEHTVGHFGQEDRWMQATGFAPENCHTSQHAQVLALMQEVTRLAAQHRDFGPLERVLPELGPWFTMHAQSMDASLATHMEQRGFDPVTGQMNTPLPPAVAPISGCGGSSCSPAEHRAQATAEHAA